VHSDDPVPDTVPDESKLASEPCIGTLLVAVVADPAISTCPDVAPDIADTELLISVHAPPVFLKVYDFPGAIFIENPPFELTSEA
jgi:hypothetical protein